MIEDQDASIADRESKSEERESTVVDSSIQQFNHEAIQPSDNETIILVVEDNADMRAYIRRGLESDYKVVEAQDGKAGLEKALEMIPDLVISDVMMPVMDGYALCDRLKSDEKTSHVPVILLTAKAGREDKLAGLETGADDYLTKPFDAKELQVRIKSLIALRRKLQEKFRKQMMLRPSEISITSFDEAFLKKTVAVVEAHLEEESFSPDDLAREVGMSRAQFYRKMRALAGQPAGLFIRSIRLQRAADLLKQGAGTVTEIAYKVGFSSQPYFSKCFQEYFGMTPREYKLLNC
jgi:DNA-binding response OmpR family regulator